MSRKQEPSQQAEPKVPASSSLEAAIRLNVMQELGRPVDLLHVQVRPLWDNHYRVNVFVGADVASAKVAHSFFLATDGDGVVLVSAPAILKQY
jgi:hypothetical protein